MVNVSNETEIPFAWFLADLAVCLGIMTAFGLMNTSILLLISLG